MVCGAARSVVRIGIGGFACAGWRGRSGWAERCVEDAIRERGDLLSEESCARLMRVWTGVAGGARAQQGESDNGAVGGADVAVAGRRCIFEEAEMANARRYLQLLDEVEEQAGAMDLSLLKRRLDDLYAERRAGCRGGGCDDDP